jgi:hypothetical protein
VRRERVGVGLLVIAFITLFFLEPLPVHAASTLIQQNTSVCVCGGNPVVVAVPFSSNVAMGDVIVVGLAFEQFGAVIPPLTDSLGSTFTQAVMATVSPGHVAAIYTATLSSSGADTVTVTFSNSHGGGQFSTTYQVYIYEVAGVTTTGAHTATGSGLTGGSFSTSSTVSFPVGAFLLGVIYYSTPEPGGTTTAGAGFTLSPVTCPAGGCQTAAEYSDPVSSLTNFPASSTQNTEWAEAGIALMPTPSIIPEYPFGLPILAILMLIGYGLVRRRTRTAHA